MFAKFSRKFLSVFVVVMALGAFGVTAAFAQTPEPPMTVAEIITAGSGLVTDFGLMPYITVAAIVGIAVVLYARFRRASR